MRIYSEMKTTNLKISLRLRVLRRKGEGVVRMVDRREFTNYDPQTTIVKDHHWRLLDHMLWMLFQK